MTPRAGLALLTCLLLLWQTLGCGGRTVAPPKAPLPPAVFKPLNQALTRSYDELFRTAAQLEFSSRQIEAMPGVPGASQA